MADKNKPYLPVFPSHTEAIGEALARIVDEHQPPGDERLYCFSLFLFPMHTAPGDKTAGTFVSNHPNGLEIVRAIIDRVPEATWTLDRAKKP